MARGSIRVYQTSSFELSFLKARNEPGLNLNQVNVTKTGLPMFNTGLNLNHHLFDIEIHLNLTSSPRLIYPSVQWV